MVDDRMVIFGGMQGNQRLGVVRQFDFSTRQWTILFKFKDKKAIFQGRYGHSAVKTGSNILVFGGSEDQLKGDLISFDLDKSLFKRLASPLDNEEDEDKPGPREFHQAVFHEDSSRMFVIGGKDRNVRVSSIHQFKYESSKSSLVRDITKLFEARFEKTPYLGFEMNFKQGDKHICRYFAPSAFIKVRCL